MQINKYLYSFNYDKTESELCKLESRNVFDKEEKDKLLFSDIKADPSNSAFIKNRMDISLFSKDYTTLINEIKKEKICVEGFKVEYVVLDGDETDYKTRLEKLRDIGYSIEGNSEYYKPTITYGLSNYKSIWYFGVLIKNNFDWHKHKKKPCSYSNSISINIAKTLVNIASNGKEEKKLLDACCGVGTIMLEACFAANEIEGCDINWKTCRNARNNIAHFNYDAKIFCSDIKDINKNYDAAIIDLPYNLISHITDDDVLHIIKSTAKITARIVIVSIADISNLISKIGFKISDFCIVNKRGKTSFARKIWLCERINE